MYRTMRILVRFRLVPVCLPGTTRTGCVRDTNYPGVYYNYIIEQVGSGATAYATIRGTVTSSDSTSGAFPGIMNGYIMNGYIASKTSDIYFDVVYGNNKGSRFYVIDNTWAGISWAVDATGAISAPPQPITIGGCRSNCSVRERWCDNHNGTITDTTTGLVWLKDAGWGGQHNWFDAGTLATQVKNGTPASLTDGSQAGQWRLPTIDELKALTTGTEAIRSSSMYLFTSVKSWYYWSSTTNATNTSYAWIVYMVDGSSVDDANKPALATCGLFVGDNRCFDALVI
ncbi:MAG: DUF1566 domain-containing protein [Deltaproteobacteria bacterium]|nr:DUF1566 domain-containing protein [Deltaproteobacteria bacterium]